MNEVNNINVNYLKIPIKHHRPNAAHVFETPELVHGILTNKINYTKLDLPKSICFIIIVNIMHANIFICTNLHYFCMLPHQTKIFKSTETLIKNYNCGHMHKKFNYSIQLHSLNQQKH